MIGGLVLLPLVDPQVRIAVTGRTPKVLWTEGPDSVEALAWR